MTSYHAQMSVFIVALFFALITLALSAYQVAMAVEADSYSYGGSSWGGGGGTGNSVYNIVDAHSYSRIPNVYYKNHQLRLLAYDHEDVYRLHQHYHVSLSDLDWKLLLHKDVVLCQLLDLVLLQANICLFWHP